jgi:hypothetical protein
MRRLGGWGAEARTDTEGADEAEEDDERGDGHVVSGYGIRAA